VAGSEALADRVTGHKAVYEQKEPYTDKEVELILAEALRHTTGGRHEYSSQPATFRLLLELMLLPDCALVTLFSTIRQKYPKANTCGSTRT
jgi:hypothetical protein